MSSSFAAGMRNHFAAYLESIKKAIIGEVNVRRSCRPLGIFILFQLRENFLLTFYEKFIIFVLKHHQVTTDHRILAGEMVSPPNISLPKNPMVFLPGSALFNKWRQLTSSVY